MFENLHLQLDINSAFEVIKPLSLFIIALVIYCIFIFKFYKNLTRKDLFEINLNKFDGDKNPNLKKFFSVLNYLLKHIFVFPVFIFLWFITFALLLVFFSKNASVQTIALISMALIGAIRVLAYYEDELGKEVAKILPFSLIGVFILDITSFSFRTSVQLLNQTTYLISTLIVYIVFIILLEIFLRSTEVSYKRVKLKFKEKVLMKTVEKEENKSKKPSFAP